MHNQVENTVLQFFLIKTFLTYLCRIIVLHTRAMSDQAAGNLILMLFVWVESNCTRYLQRVVNTSSIIEEFYTKKPLSQEHVGRSHLSPPYKSASARGTSLAYQSIYLSIHVSSYHNLQKKIIHPFHDTSLLLFSADGIFYTGARTWSTVAWHVLP